jgi:thiamine-phosphate pyrophosphorylase
VTLLQLRAKQAPAGWLLDVTCQILRRAERDPAAQIIVNDRADVARIAGAHGIHVGQDDLPVAAVRAIVGDRIVGSSTHTGEQLDRALAENVSYVAIGPVFETATKNTGYRPVGVTRVREVVASAAGRPVVAIGGITLDRVAAVVDAGAGAVAVIGDLLATGDPAARARDYLRRLRSLAV